ncbi:ATP synthase-coupling factor 6, mitochondrial-like [Chelonus insularis]|uniref:ATP synthase-coupling factor 6, mitochondrial-like n=1 Tax=Chelonus insularis TaxID=460826 RepID=UPI00158ED743|nr:ATP synthase-coupling factor 6, mitochondrial-like [Chelonus insularis]XP_034952351.1 ATP synthase-coupling factor 6, mitochondrial-like [Chelonus insularis]XP_034952352.1 ATP synthase-coupling factor 6, mitochondrial-like [Chelonus insularis]
MLTPRAIGIPKLVKRNIGIMAPAMQKVADPIQQLFLDKIREYKAKSVGGKMVDPSPELERELKNDLDRIATQYGGGPGVDMTKFPTFKFEEPKVDYSAQSSAK